MDDNTGGDDVFSMAGGITSQVCILASRLEVRGLGQSSVEQASSYNWGQMDDISGGDDFFSMAGRITSQVCIHASRLEVRGVGAEKC